MSEAPSQPKKRQKYSYADKYEMVLYYEANDLSSTVDRYFPSLASSKRHSAKNLVLDWASPKNRAKIEANAKSTKTKKNDEMSFNDSTIEL
ncbi:hypothetical protein SPRG_15463 [Saprolegnia parasitica CBS 223.65]|uniref:Uncharacterized protein n=1 Tax=Saprolegnia parasitica (strain CBS 223.65) TaxID=695850 RepID=A0A067BME0_SAPPC|nr:hypothetical protein SPRG_15463 [Saprolegnia parasitica CBS 223.65]KDO19373.1 hypothetical protein SPRG_15463 [Saprolegnia parasitica CBS 223.65]|eukprot:XP_012209919.1 hypothetical protein SPRG_15463 [Saprolegnia parasitica CBS 223.65]